MSSPGHKFSALLSLHASHSATTEADRFAFLKVLLIIAGMAIGIAIFDPQVVEFDPSQLDHWQMLHAAVLAGVGITYFPLIARRAFRGHPIELGGFFLLTLGVCAWSLLLPALADRNQPNGIRVTPTAWIVWIWSLLALSMLLAALAIVRGDVRRLFHSPSWSDRLGIILALAWAPQGAWVVWAVYHDGPLLRG
ncbi:MAG: hypothetical protein K1X71_19960 [Pirellulales bacterium]|nr:hypothetical protein [Pirellulales bacterium]